jgi:quinol monooxygenase YgiN
VSVDAVRELNERELSMAVTRINRFMAADGALEPLRGMLESIVPLIRQADGSLDCRLLQSTDDPNEFVVLEVWASVEAHQAAVKSIPSELIANIMPLVASPPGGSYYAAVVA